MTIDEAIKNRYRRVVYAKGTPQEEYGSIIRVGLAKLVFVKYENSDQIKATNARDLELV